MTEFSTPYPSFQTILGPWFLTTNNNLDARQHQCRPPPGWCWVGTAVRGGTGRFGVGLSPEQRHVVVGVGGADEHVASERRPGLLQTGEHRVRGAQTERQVAGPQPQAGQRRRVVSGERHHAALRLEAVPLHPEIADRAQQLSGHRYWRAEPAAQTGTARLGTATPTGVRWRGGGGAADPQTARPEDMQMTLPGAAQHTRRLSANRNTGIDPHPQTRRVFN